MEYGWCSSCRSMRISEATGFLFRKYTGKCEQCSTVLTSKPAARHTTQESVRRNSDDGLTNFYDIPLHTRNHTPADDSHQGHGGSFGGGGASSSWDSGSSYDSGSSSDSGGGGGGGD